MGFTLKQLADVIDGVVDGDATIEIDSINTPAEALSGQITFLSDSRYKKELQNTSASAVILRQEDRAACPVTALIVSNPYAAYAEVANLLYPAQREIAGIHPTAVVDDSCEIAADVWIGPHCVIGRDVRIESGCQIGPGCLIEHNAQIGADSVLIGNVAIMHHCAIGQRVLAHPGAVVGSDGFGQANDNGRWIKIPQVGRAIIGDDVEIGANTTIDRGSIGDTVVEEGVKLDNLIHIAHNVRVGAHTVMAAGTGIAGSTTIGRNCMIGGSVGISGHLSIADNVTLTGRTTVLQSVKESGVYSSGTPVETNRQWHKNYTRFKQLDEMAKRIKNLEKLVAKLEGKGN
ncbi:MAG: UDP-3-O-(3-hydroxymyristoyl)glucosamine N-acyltransferase [Gammaproteobacteria bacterium]|nr:UDP-3-O-(3-hydroxymyristoyl)glucosamine N-acyltransferase [Gammaproteobacteria bacterium]